VRRETDLTGVALLERETALFVVNAEPQIEAAEQFDEPLVGQRLRDEDEDPFRFSHGQEALEDEAGFDGFSQAHFVGEENAWNLARGNFLQNIKLVRDEFDAAAQKTADLGLAETRLGLQRTVAEIEDFARIGLAGHEALLREIDAGDVGDFVFTHALAGGDIGDEPGRFLDGFDREGGPFPGRDAFARAELHALQHGRAEGVEAFFSSGGECDGDAFRRDVDGCNHAESQLGFPFAQATLSNDAQ
jgi:hypothetical protein